MNDSIHIRPATREDAPTLADFNCRMAQETEAIQLPPQTVLAGVQRLIDKPDLGFYLIAETKQQTAASLMITYEWSDWRNGLFWWLQSVYVHPDWRRQGLYRQLHNEVCERARQQGGVCGLRLYVAADNHPAQQTYQRTGMHQTHYQMYETLFNPGN